MLKNRISWRKKSALAALIAGAFSWQAPQANAATLYWDVNGTAAAYSTVVGAWDGTNAFFNTDPTGGNAGSTSATVGSANDLIIPQATTNSGTITTSGTQSASSITFAPNVGPTATIAGTAITIGGTGASSGIFQQSSGANTITAGLTLNSPNTAFDFSNSSTGLLTIGAVTGSAAGLQTINVGSSAAGGITLNGIIGNGGGGGTVGLTINNTGAGVTTLSGANTFSGGLTINAGTAVIATAASVNALGSGTVTIGNALNTGADATLRFNGSGAFPTFTNPISVTGTGTSTIIASGWNPILNGAMTLSNNLTIGSNNASGSSLTFGGGVTGTGNITVSLNTPHASNLVNFSGATAVNNVGTLTFNNASVGGGAVGTGTGTNTISAAVGTNVTQITQGSNSNPLTVSGAITVGATNKIFNSTGNALFTISGGASGTGNVTFNANSTGGITVSGTTLNNTGTVTNSGTNSGTTTISAVIGPLVTSVTQSSATSPLVLSGANTYTVATAITAGSVTVSNATGLGTVAGGVNVSSGAALQINGVAVGAEALTLNGSGISAGGSLRGLAGTSSYGGAITLGSDSRINTDSGVMTVSGAIGGAFALTVGGNGHTIISGNIAATVTPLTKDDTGFLSLSGTNAYNGGTTVTTGGLTFLNTNAKPAAGTHAFAAGTTLGLGVATTGAFFTSTDVDNAFAGNMVGNLSNVTVTPTTNIGIDTSAGSFTYANVVVGNPTRGLVKLGANTLTLGTANTYTGATWVQNGTLSVGSVGNVTTPIASSLGMPANATDGTISLGYTTTTGTLSYTGGATTTDRVINLAGTTGGGGIDNSGTGTLTFSNPITFTGTGAKSLTISGASNTTFGAAVAGGGAGSTSPLTIQKNGAGTLLLNATGPTNTNTATRLNITGGIVDIGPSGLTLSNSGADVITPTVDATINATGGGVLTLSSAAANGGADIRPPVNTTLTINANIATPVTNTGFWTGQGGALELNGAGTLVLNGTNVIGGNTIITVDNGTISVGNIATNLGGTTGFIFNNNGSRFRYTGVAATSSLPFTTATNTTAIIDQSGTSGTLNLTANFSGGAAAKTLTLQGSTAGIGQMSGIISNNGTNLTNITKAGTGSWVLSGANTYTGATTVNGGNLQLLRGATGTTGNSAVTVNNSGTLSVVGNYTIGNAGTAAAGGRLTLASGGTLDLADGSINDLILTQNATFATAGAAFNGGTIKLDVSGADADSIINSGGTIGSTSSGMNAIVINPIAGFDVGSYTIISGGAGTGTISNANFYLASSTINVGGSPFTLALSQVGKDELLTITAGAGGAPNLAYWNGTTNSSWAHQPGGAGTATNFVAAASGGPDTFSLPGGGATGTNVFVSSNVVGPGGLSTTLDAAFNINSLNFTGTGTSNTAGTTIAAGTGGTLTLNAAAVNGNTAGNGMTIAAGSGANTISAPITLGASQTWTNNSTNATTVSGVISGAGLNLTKAGTGPMTLGGAASNTYSGLTTVVGSAGTAGGLTLAKTGGALAIPGNLTVGNGTATTAFVLFGESEQISPTATVTLNGVNNGWAYLNLQGRTQTIGNIVETLPGYGVIETKETQVGAFGTSNVIFNVASGTQSYQGYFRDINTGLDAANSLKMTKSGAGTLQWGAATGTNAAGASASARNYSGGTDIQNGTLQLTAPNTAGNSISIVGAGNVSLNGGATFAGTLDLNGLNAGITGLDGTTGTVLGQVVNNVNASTATLTIGNNNNSGSYAGLLLNNSNAGTGILGITKIGTGTQVLSGTNSYSGTTTISGGILRITNSSALGTVAGGTTQSGTSALELDGSLGAITVGAEALSINGGGISNAGALRNIAGNNTYGGAITLAGQSRINSDSGTLTLNNTAAVTSTNLTLVVGGAGNTTISGAIALGTGGVAKDGIGTLTLGGTSTYTGNTVVSAGTLNITGTLTGNNTATAIAYGGTAGNTVVNVSNNITAYIMTGANVAGSNAVYNQTAGTVTLSPPNNDLQYVGKTAGYGYFNLTGGNFNVSGRFDQNSTGGTASTAAYIGNGGTLTQNSTDWMILAYSGTAQMTVGPNGTLTRTGATNPLGIMLNTANAYGSLNIAGGTVNTAAQSIRFGNGNVNNTTGFVNLAGGTLSIGTIGTINIGTGTGNNAYYNFAGGTLLATATLAAGFAPATTGSITVTNTVFGPINNFAATGNTSQNFVGGLTIDTQANPVTLPVASTLLGATGDGIAQSSLTVTPGTGYIGAPVVTFTGGTLAPNGTPATGYALINGGAVTGIVITNPGEYTVAPTLTLTGGGGTGASVSVGTLVTNANTGGLTKLGSGTLTISSTNTFGGVVDIKVGLLTTTVLAAGGSPSGIGQSSNAAGNLLLNSSTPTTLAASGGGILGYNGTVAGTTDRNFTLNNVSGGFDASGTVLGTFTLTGTTMSVTPGLGNATLTLQGTGTGSTGAGSIGTLLADGTGTTVGVSKFGTGTWAVTNPANSYTGPTVISGGILSVPTITAAGAPSTLGQSSNAAANLVLKGGTLQYTGAGATLNRNYTFGDATTAAGGGFDTTGATGPLVITSNMTGANTAAGTQVLTLTSVAASGANRVNGVISDSTGTALTGVTKAGDGAWTLAGANTYSGATTISAGTLQFAGSSSLNSTTQIGIAAGATLQIRDDAAGTINHTTNNITASSAGTVTIDVGNNGGATTNSTVAFGVLSSGTAANALAMTYNFTGSNNYTQRYSSLALPGTTGSNTTLNPTTTSVTIAGPVTSQMAGFANTNSNTLFLGGTSSDNAITGVISDAVGASPTANGLTLITKQGTSTWTLSGANTYRGATTINGGTLIIPNSSSVLANTAISVNPAATGPNPTFVVTPGNSTINLGNTSDTTRGATLTLNPGTASNPLASAFTMQDSAIGVVNLVQGATFTGNALTLGLANTVGYVKPSLSFDIGGTTLFDIDVINVTKQATVGSGGVVLNFAALTTSTSLATGNYTFLNAGAGSTLLGGALTLGTSVLSVGANNYSLSLANSTATSGILTVTALASNVAPYWQGDINGSWSSQPGGTGTVTNFATTLAASADTLSLPDLNSNVTFTTAVASNLSTTLDANFTINSLNFNGTGTSNTAGSTIASGAGTNTLTINAAALNGNTAGNGISVGTGSGPNTISAPVALGASQSWTVATGTSLTVSGDVSGTGFALTLPGNGTVTLSGNNSYSGGTNLNAGTLNINSATAISTGPLSVINATIDNTTASPITLSANNIQTWANNGALAFTGTRALNLGTGAVTLGADATAGSFTLTNNSLLAGTSLTIGGNISAIAGGTAGVKTLTIAGPGSTALTGNITKGSASNIAVTVTSGGTTTLSGPASSIQTININGGANSIVDLGAGNLTITNAGTNGFRSTTGGTINATGGGKIILGSDLLDNGTADGTVLTVNAGITGPFTFEIYGGAANNTGVTVLTAQNTFTGQVDINGGNLSVSNIGNTGSLTSNLGSGTNIRSGAATLAGSTVTTGKLIYTGAGETTNRILTMAGAGFAIEQAATSGHLVFSAPVSVTNTAAKTLYLLGSEAGTAELAGAISNNTAATSVTKLGTGTWTLSGANTYTGATTVNGGILRLSNSVAPGATPVSVTGGTLQFNNANALSTLNTLSMSGTGTVDLNGFSVTVGGTATGVAGNTITNNSSSTSASTATTAGTPSGTGVYVDALNITGAQTANIAALITDGPTRKTQIILTSSLQSTTLLGNTGNTFSGGLVLAHNANGTRLAATVSPITGTPWGTGPIIVGQAATDKAQIAFYTTAGQTMANPIISNTRQGSDLTGTVRVDVATTFSGTLTANLAPFTFSTNGVGVSTVTGKVTGSSGLVLDFMGGSISAGTAMNVILNNSAFTNDYQGDTVINNTATVGKSATLTLGNNNQIPNGTGTGNVVINTNGTGVGLLNMAGFSETINGLSGNGTVEGATTGTPTNTLTLGDNNATGVTFSGIIRNTAGTLSLTKVGTGIQTLSGVNTFTGATTVSNGTLIVGVGGVGSLGATTTTVSAGATLGGSGTIGGATTVSGSVAPGNSIGTLAVNNNVTWNGGNAWVWELGTGGGTLAAPGTGDLLNITAGDFIKGTGSSWAFDFSNTGAAGVYKLVDWTGTTVFDASNFTASNIAGGLTPSFTVDNATSALYVTLSSGSVVLGASAANSGAFGNLLVGANASTTVTLTNNGTVATTSITANGPLPGFTLGAPVSGAVNPAANTTASVTVDTSSPGLKSGNLTYTADPGSVVSTPVIALSAQVGNALYGTTMTAATPALYVTPAGGLSSSGTGTAATSTPVALNSTATVLYYRNSTGTDTSVNMNWRTRTAAEAKLGEPLQTSGTNGSGKGVGYLISDVVSLTGMVNTTGVNATDPVRQTDPFVLQVSYNQGLLGSDPVSAQNHETAGAPLGHIFLAWNDSGTWVNAVEGNIGGTPTFAGVTSWQTYYNMVSGVDDYTDIASFIGSYGVDPANDVAWAVLNHNSEFAVIPEPSTLVLGGLALLGFAGAGLRRRRMIVK